MVLPTALTVIMVGVFFGIYSLILSNMFHKPSGLRSELRLVGHRVLIETELFTTIHWTARYCVVCTVPCASRGTRASIALGYFLDRLSVTHDLCPALQ
ncbi:hypothetical protein AUF78_00785 [archaeon 13_1_20CM_2_51_12]|nr:MAG: hypothetical protein AUF78_00785 [archaeon 13_1_20CM_2_51_12]